MVNEVITRKFGLKASDNSMVDISAFQNHRKAVNIMINAGLELEDQLFEKDTLKAVKTFFTQVKNVKNVRDQLQKLPIRERVRRCASQYAYFAVREHKHRSELLKMVAKVLLKDQSWADYSRDNCTYWQMPPKGREKKRNDFPHTNLLAQVQTLYLQSFLDRTGIVEYAFLGNTFRQVRNLVFEELKKQEILIIDSKIEKILQQAIISHYTTDYLTELLKKYIRRLSRALTFKFNTLHRIKSDKSTKGLHLQDKPLNNAQIPLESLILTITQGQEPSKLTTTDWQKYRKKWRVNLLATLTQHLTQVNLVDIFNEALEKIKSEFNSNMLFKVFFYPERHYFHSTLKGASLAAYQSFIQDVMVHHLKFLLTELHQGTISELIKFILVDIEHSPASWQKTPLFAQQSIPVGIDDGQVYQLLLTDNNSSSESNISTTGTSSPPRRVEVKLSLQAYRHHVFQLQTPTRFYKLIDCGYIPLRGVLILTGSKLILALPFSQRLPELRPMKPVTEQRIVGADLGLRTFCTLSLCQDSHELTRTFLDQRELMGPRDSWFLPHKLHQEKMKEGIHFINYKRELALLQRRMYHLQSEIDELKNFHRVKRLKDKTLPRYTHLAHFRRLKRARKACKRNINNLHKELVHQIATRLVAFCLYHQADALRFEDLRWSRHSSRFLVGYYFAPHQMHWFFSQIQILAAQIARRYGLRVYRTDARHTSRLCPHCGHPGERRGKHFRCLNEACGVHLDSDLVASRNLCTPSRPISLML